MDNYPPPPGFDGDEHGTYGDDNYQRELSPVEQAVIDADIAEEEAVDRARAEIQRDAFFSFAGRPTGRLRRTRPTAVRPP